MPASRRFTVIRGARVHDAATGLAEPGDILIDGQSIAEVGPPGLDCPADALVVDAADRLALPGFVNMHTHGHGVMGRGLLPEKAGLEVFLAGAGPTMRGRTDEDKYLGGLVNAIEMVTRGITTCFDMFAEAPLPSMEGVAAVARGYAEVGIRAVVAPMVSDRTIFQAMPGLTESLDPAHRAEAAALAAQPTGDVIGSLERVYRDWPADADRVAPGLAPTIPLHCSDELMLACRDMAREIGAPMQIHLAETEAQARAGVARYGKSLTAHLDGLGMLGPDVSLAHGVWLSDDDMRRIAASGAGIVHNPASNLRLGSGIAQVVAMRARGVRVCLGTDGCNTSDHLNMFEVQRLACGLSRVASHETDAWLSTREAFDMATEAGALALGRRWRTGRLRKGHLADIVLIDLTRTQYWPLRDPVGQMVFSEDGSGVSQVYVGGRLVVDCGRPVGIDLDLVRARVQAAADRIERESRDGREAADALGDGVRRYVGAHKSCGCGQRRITP